DIRVPETEGSDFYIFSCVDGNDSQKYKGSIEYSCYDKNISIKSSTCGCGDGYVVSDSEDDCLKVVCGVKAGDFSNDVEYCISEFLNNDGTIDPDIVKIIPYTGDTIGKIETNDNCTGDIEYTCKKGENSSSEFNYN
ncbi:hypothetical protein N9C35_05390, partial [Flavobacteriaceae bacterium]|nr:hypothetical protein [Flavobacteriaceae bacterium]